MYILFDREQRTMKICYDYSNLYIITLKFFSVYDMMPFISFINVFKKFIIIIVINIIIVVINNIIINILFFYVFSFPYHIHIK